MTTPVEKNGNPGPQIEGHSLARNVVFNIIGQTLPILIAIFSIPALIHSLGTEKFGVLALAWVLAGYFNLFDLGLGRAVVRIVVQKMTRLDSELFQVTWAAFVIATGLGILGGTVLYISAEWLTVHFFAVNDQLHSEVVNSLRIMGVVIPFVVSSTIFRGVLEAFQKFDWINYVQVPIGALTYLLPLLMASRTTELPWIIATLVFVRVTLWLVFLLLCSKCVRAYPRSFIMRMGVIKELLSFGFWISMSNLIQPFLSYLDRFLIGSMISMVAVAYYTAPMEIVLKFWILPGAVISVMYPALSANVHSIKNLRTLYFRSTRFLIIVIAPLSFFLAVMSEEVLRIWISAEYAHESSTVLTILSLGIFANCIGFVPAAYLQAVGRPSVPARFHVIEFPLYAVCLYVGLKVDGVVGAACAWMVRVLADSFVLHFASLRRLESLGGLRNSVFAILLFFATAGLFSQMQLPVRAGAVILFFAMAPLIGWYYVLSSDDQKYLLDRLFKANWRPSLTEVEARPPIRKLGIAMAVYSPEPVMFLRQIDSLKKQTFGDWVCIVTVDSKVEDLLNSTAVSDALSDPRFRIEQNTERLGATKNFERAVGLVVQQQIDALAFCDQDDIWYPEKLAILIRELEKHPYGSLVHCDMRVVEHGNQGNKVVSESAWHHEDRKVLNQTPLHFLVRNCVTGAASLMDISIARRFWRIPDSFKYHDQWYALVASAHGGVYPVFEILYDYVQHGKNAVGVVPYHGFFYRPPHVRWTVLFRRSVDSWRMSLQMISDFKSRGFTLGFIESMWAKKSVIGGLLFLWVGILYVNVDASFARACVIKGCGRILLISSKWEAGIEK